MERIGKKLHLIFCLLCLSLPLYAQFPERELSWKNIGIDGQPVTVFSIIKDNRGIMWMGTDKGLFFYDGLSTHSVGAEILGEYQVHDIVRVNDCLYIGTNNGLFTYDYDTGEISYCEGGLPGEIRSLLISGDVIWIGSLYGIYSLNIKNKKIEELSEGLPNKSVYSLLKDSRGILYAGTYNGLARWDSIGKKFHSVEIDNNPREKLFINSLLETEDRKSIYVGGQNSLYTYTPSTDRWEKSKLVTGFNVKSMIQGKNGHLILGTDDGLFDIYKDTLKQYRHDSRQPQSIAQNEIWSVYFDEQNNIWAGHERGFSIASNSEIIKVYNLGELTNQGEGNEIGEIHRDISGNLWLGGSNGLIRMSKDGKVKWFRHNLSSSSLSHNRVRDILETEDGALWFATDDGINLYNGNDGFLNYHISDSTRRFDANWSYSLAEIGNSLLIGSFLGGLLEIEKEKLKTGSSHNIADLAINSYSQPWISNDLVNRIAKDGQENLWVLLFRDNSLVKFNREMDKIADYNIFELSGGYPTHLISDNRGRIWCGFKGGVILFDQEGKHKNIYLDDTSSDETILSMGKVKDDIWIATRSNLWKINGETFLPTILPLPQKNYTSIYNDPISGKVFLGSIDEIFEVNTDLLDKSSDYKSVRLVIEKKDDKNWVLSENIKPKGLRLKYGGTLDLLVSTLNYSPEMEPRYMYKLGINLNDTIDDWHILPKGSNNIILSDLKMGKYIVMIKTEGSPSVSDKIPLKVDSPMALSWWAISLYSLSLLLLILGIIIFLNLKRKKDLVTQERKTELRNVERKLTFLSSISHDLKTPLSMIIGPVSLMKEKAKDNETRKNLETVYNNALRLNNMIQKTIELQHMEDAGESLLIISKFDIIEFCRSIFTVFEENHPDRKFLFHASAEQVFIEADSVKMESIISNLLSNACKYSFDGSTISLGINIEDGKVLISVADDGIGISEDDCPLIFQRMYRSPKTASVKEGTGLGLYLIKRYLEQMKGEIYVFSRLGEGSTFNISLPIIPVHDKVDKREKSSDEESGKPKILVVEDNSEVSSFIYELLNKNYNVITAENGRTGLSIAGSFNPHLIIADEMMPVMTGMEMVKRIKENPKLNSTPIVMLTAKTDNKTETESIKNGIDAFMEKPFDPNTLLIKIEQLLKKRNDLLEKFRMEAIVENETKPIVAESITEKNIANIIRIIEENISDPDLNVEMLCKKSGLSNKNLYRLIKKHLGKAPLEFIRTIRLQKAAALLSQKRFTVSEVCYMVGFKTPSYFTKCFQAEYGVNPSDYS